MLSLIFSFIVVDVVVDIFVALYIYSLLNLLSLIFSSKAAADRQGGNAAAEMLEHIQAGIFRCFVVGLSLLLLYYEVTKRLVGYLYWLCRCVVILRAVRVTHNNRSSKQALSWPRGLLKYVTSLCLKVATCWYTVLHKRTERMVQVVVALVPSRGSAVHATADRVNENDGDKSDEEFSTSTCGSRRWPWSIVVIWLFGRRNLIEVDTTKSTTTLGVMLQLQHHQQVGGVYVLAYFAFII